MIDINLSGCKSLDEIRDTVHAGIPEDILVRNRREARRWFRKRNIKGRIHESIAFREHKTVGSSGPLRRDMLVCTLVTEYRAGDQTPERTYSIDIITY